jgi:DNA-binding transcriptional regulator YiaG
MNKSTAKKEVKAFDKPIQVAQQYNAAVVEVLRVGKETNLCNEVFAVTMGYTVKTVGLLPKESFSQN